jgi:hypothetical protein
MNTETIQHKNTDTKLVHEEAITKVGEKQVQKNKGNQKYAPSNSTKDQDKSTDVSTHQNTNETNNLADQIAAEALKKAQETLSPDLQYNVKKTKELKTKMLGSDFEKSAAVTPVSNKLTPKQQELYSSLSRMIAQNMQDGIKKYELLRTAYEIADLGFKKSLAGMKATDVLSQKQDELYNEKETIYDLAEACNNALWNEITYKFAW